MNQEINESDLVWWILAADDLVTDAQTLINIANDVPSSDVVLVDDTLERILQILEKIKAMEKRLNIPFPFMKELIQARLTLVLDKNSTYME